MDWLSQHLWAAWFLGAVALATAEMLTLDFTLLMLAGGAAAGGITALLIPGLWPVQLAVAAVTAFMMLAVLRPTLLRRIREDPGYTSTLDGLIGGTGVALKEITKDAGEVLVNSETWSARVVGPEPIGKGDEVVIQRIDGVTVYVSSANTTQN